MLKTQVGDHVRLVQQPQHAQVSGYLAAHWGNRNGFARPGHYPGIAHPARVHDAVVLAIAEHDNGWMEWETVPRFSANDGLPIGLGETSADLEPRELSEWRAGGFERWRQGINRLARPYPYAALLVSLHAYWLYAVHFDDLLEQHDELHRHFLFSGTNDAPNLTGDTAVTRAFLDEQASLQRELKARIAEDAELADAIAPDCLAPHLRLLQLMDTLSLHLALNNRGEYTFPGLPRADWSDRVDLNWSWQGDTTIRLDPYPFDLDPLPVHIPARVVALEETPRDERIKAPFASLHAAPFETIEVSFVSA